MWKEVRVAIFFFPCISFWGEKRLLCIATKIIKTFKGMRCLCFVVLLLSLERCLFKTQPSREKKKKEKKEHSGVLSAFLFSFCQGLIAVLCVFFLGGFSAPPYGLCSFFKTWIV